MSNQNDVPALESLREDIAAMPVNLRYVLRRRVVDGLKQEDIRKELGLAQNTISNYWQAAHDELKIQYYNPRGTYDPAVEQRQKRHHAQVREAFKTIPLTEEEINYVAWAKAASEAKQAKTSTSQPTPIEPESIDIDEPEPDVGRDVVDPPPAPPFEQPANPTGTNQQAQDAWGGVFSTVTSNPTPAQQTRNFRVRNLLIGLGLFALGAVVFALLRPAPPPQVIIATPTLGPSPTPIVEVMMMTPSESEIAPLVAATVAAMPTQTALIVRETHVATATPGPSPTPIIVTATPLPEAPTTPEPQTPTELPTPTSQPTQVGNLLVPFEDNFDSAWQPEWDASGGRLSLASGRLTSASDLPFVLWLGDDKLTDYTVEFDYEARWGIDLYVGPNFRWLDRFGNTVNGYSPRHWQEKKPSTNQWTQISPEFFNMQSGRFKLVVQGDKYLLSVNNGDPVEYVIDGIKPKGPFGIGLQRNTFIDNFRLSVP